MEPGQARRLQAAALGRLRRSFTAERQRQDPQTHVARTVLGELRATGELGLNPVGILTIFCWSERRDLNSGPPVPQSDNCRSRSVTLVRGYTMFWRRISRFIEQPLVMVPDSD